MASDTETAPTISNASQMLVQITTEGVPKLHCPVCNKTMVSLTGYVKHVKKHEPPGGFLCRYCESRYCHEEELKTHLDEVHTTIACRICKATFVNADDYREHIRVVHNGIDRVMFKCDKCGAEYKTQEPFKRHMDTQCNTIKPHKCEVCGMTFNTKYILKQHVLTHSGEKRFCCSYCGKSFAQKGRLVEHERTHTGQKPYKCDVCGKCFAHRESIVTHSSIHTGVRLVECRCCHSRFSCYSNLIKHRRTRPETCGRPEFDPPKHRGRNIGTRIPPTLMPTSEIKISNLNRIIKPDDAIQLQKKEAANVSQKKEAANVSQKKEAANVSQKKETSTTKHIKTTARKSTGGGKRGRPRKTTQNNISKKQQSKTEEDESSEDEIISNLVKKEDAKKDKIAATTDSCKIWPDDNEDEFDNIFNDPTDDDESDLDDKPLIKVLENDKTTINIKEEHLDDTVDMFGSSCYMETNFDVKDETQEEFIDSLLNDDDNNDKQPLIKVENVLIEIAEDMLFEDEPETLEDQIETDMLAIRKKDRKCKVMRDNVIDQYPKLENQSIIVHVDHDDTSLGEQSGVKSKTRKTRRTKQEIIESDDFGEDSDYKAEKTKTKRKYRKRGEPKIQDDETAPKRIGTLTAAELKKRLKILKKDNRNWKCPHCVKIYHMRRPFERHLREEHDVPEEDIREMLKSSDVGVVNEEIFKCDICEKIYLMEKRLISHKQLHGEDGKLIHQCPCYCKLYFASKDEAMQHAQEMHRESLYCDICDKFMKGHEGLKHHMRNFHTIKQSTKKEPEEDSNSSMAAGNAASSGAKRNFICDKCGRKFTARTSLTDHVRSDCGKNPLYPCTQCGKHFTTAGILKTHMLLHKDETPYQCEQCGKTFKVKAQYKTHIKTRHTDIKPFKCHLCPKAYPYRESLLIHMTVHTGFKRFLCNGCGKRFTCVSNLQAHRKVHADTCGLLPLNSKATQYMGVQKGNLLMGAKPEAGMSYAETNTLVAKEVIDRNLAIAQELNFSTEPQTPLPTIPLTASTLTSMGVFASYDKTFN